MGEEKDVRFKSKNNDCWPYLQSELYYATCDGLGDMFPNVLRKI